MRWQRLHRSLSSVMAASVYLATASALKAEQLVLETQETKQPPVRSRSIDDKPLPQPLSLSLFLSPSPSPSPSPSKYRHGTQVSLNGRMLPVAWSQWQQEDNLVRTGISDTGLMQNMGVELLNTSNYTQQPVRWFEDSPQIMAANPSGEYRYLDITNFARTAGWQLQVDGSTLQISTPKARVTNIQQEPQQVSASVAAARRIVVDLDRPTPWKVSHDRNVAIITIDASALRTLIERFNPPNPITPTPSPPITPTPIVQSDLTQTTFRAIVPDGWRALVTTASNPTRLVIDIAPDAMVEKDILWAPGLRWRQQFVNIGASRFPVVWLEINQRQPGLRLRPIWSNPTSLVGTESLIKTASLWQASAAVNAGFFNRKQQLPLGAIRRDNRWLSSPILNRGAIAWNDSGDIKIGKLSLIETLITPTGDRLPILALNSGYVQAGIARYTPDWGSTYTPLTDNETLVVVQNNTVSNVMQGGPFGQTKFPIPSDGYLLTLRANPALNKLFAPGSILRLESMTAPDDFARYPHILGAGPVLVQNRQIVLDAKSEKFSDAFIKEKAIRSAIATTASGTLIVAAVQNRAGGPGPTLAELAQIIQQMGAVDALNLDGGSSTSLTLGGQLINRSPSTAARVHNGLGIFVPASR